MSSIEGLAESRKDPNFLHGNVTTLDSKGSSSSAISTDELLKRRLRHNWNSIFSEFSPQELCLYRQRWPGSHWPSSGVSHVRTNNVAEYEAGLHHSPHHRRVQSSQNDKEKNRRCYRSCQWRIHSLSLRTLCLRSSSLITCPVSASGRAESMDIMSKEFGVRAVALSACSLTRSMISGLLRWSTPIYLRQTLSVLFTLESQQPSMSYRAMIPQENPHLSP